MCSERISHPPWFKAHHLCMCRALFYFTLFFWPLNPPPISFFSSYFSCDSVCPANLHFYLYPGPILVFFLCIFLKICFSRLLIYTSFSSHFFQSKLWDLEMAPSWYNMNQSIPFFCWIVLTVCREHIFSIYFTINKLLSISKSLSLQTIL